MNIPLPHFPIWYMTRALPHYAATAVVRNLKTFTLEHLNICLTCTAYLYQASCSAATRKMQSMQKSTAISPPIFPLFFFDVFMRSQQEEEEVRHLLFISRSSPICHGLQKRRTQWRVIVPKQQLSLREPGSTFYGSLQCSIAPETENNYKKREINLITKKDKIWASI